MSEPGVTISDPTATPESEPPVSVPTRSFLAHAKLIGLLTLLSRIVGLAREVVAGHYLGTGIVASAFTVAFTIPNLFRKLLGEGALSAAFIPLYAKAEKTGATEDGETATDFAAGAVNLLALILLGITLVGEAIVLGLLFATSPDRPDRALMLQFTAIMLPYVMLVCGGAFLSAILQVHKRFGPPAFAPVILNVCHIAVVVGGAWFLGLRGRDPLTPRVIELQTTLAFYLAFAVLIAGALQVGILLPALREIGFHFRPAARIWTPAIRKMLILTVPVAMGLGVLQLSVLLDKTISYGLMQGVDRNDQLVTHFNFLGQQVRYPMELGATRRLDLAQLLYQFPLGVFAIALATAIFPMLSAHALEADRSKFKQGLRTGIEASLWEGLPASLGLILVAEPATRLLFQHGQITAHDATLIARSTQVYAGAIWAFSLLQIVNRAYYAIHDMKTPLVMSAINIVLNLVVEIPLLWWLGESAMAVGTLVSFSIQTVVMLILLDRKVGGLELGTLARPVAKMLLATAIMGLVLWLVRLSPVYGTGTGRMVWTCQLCLMLAVGSVTYLLTCYALKLETLTHLLHPRRDHGN